MIRSSRRSCWSVSFALLAMLFCPALLPAQRVIVQQSRKVDTYEGVQAAALDQPRIYFNLRRTPGGKPLQTEDPEPLMGVEAFLDTGASGIVVSDDTAKKLKVARIEGAKFQDVGVGGNDFFGVSEPLYVALADYPHADQENIVYYSKPVGPFRMQLRAGGGLLDLLSPGMDVLGMPVISGKVVVLDPTGLAKFEKIETAVYAPGDKKIPKTSRHIPLTIVPFDRFTRIDPPGAERPTLVGNPMIGPNPFAPRDARKGVVVSYKGKSVSGTFLLDTGAATSMISSRLTQKLGVNLDQIPKAEQFSLAVGGIGGARESTGIYFDKLELPTMEGSISFTGAPLLVADISMQDADGKTYTLDGVLGMNYLVASVEIAGGLLPDIGKMVDGPFKSIVIDLKNNELGLEPK
jgi:hypothetical protein